MNLDGLAPDVRQLLAQELSLGHYVDEQDVLRQGSYHIQGARTGEYAFLDAIRE